MRARNLTAVVLAGGLGTRLRPVVDDVPKPIAPVAGRPFLAHVIEYLVAQGLSDVVLSVGYQASAVETAVGDGSRWSAQIRYSREEEPLGTAGAIKLAAGQVESDPFFVLNGDSLIRVDLDRLVGFHAARGARASLVASRVERADRFGSLELGRGGEVLSFEEKHAGSGWVNAGLYLFERAVLGEIPAGRRISLEEEVLPSLAGDGLYALRADEEFVDIGTPESYREANRKLEDEGAV